MRRGYQKEQENCGKIFVGISSLHDTLLNVAIPFSKKVMAQMNFGKSDGKNVQKMAKILLIPTLCLTKGRRYWNWLRIQAFLMTPWFPTSTFRIGPFRGFSLPSKRKAILKESKRTKRAIGRSFDKGAMEEPRLRNALPSLERGGVSL